MLSKSDNIIVNVEYLEQSTIGKAMTNPTT